MRQLENQMSINDFLGELLQQPTKNKALKPATSEITKATRMESNEKTKKQQLSKLVVSTLDGQELTAREIAIKMYSKGLLPYPARAVIQPRITELVESGILVATGKKLDTMTDRKVAVYKVV